MLTFEAATFSNGAVADSTFVVGSISFTAISPAGGGGDIDINPGPFNTGFDGFFDNASASVNPVFLGASVTLTSPVPGDFNLDGVVNATDVDLLAANDGGGDLTFDLDGDGLVTFQLNSASIESDSDWLIRNILQTEYGDANLDRRVNSSDAAIMGGNFGTISGASWSMGNFNGDSAVNSSDAAILGGQFGLQNTQEAIAGNGRLDVVPEPDANLLVVIPALLGLSWTQKTRGSRLILPSQRPTSRRSALRR